MGLIAVHFSGHLRTVERCLPLLCDNLFRPMDRFRFFIHTWSETDRRTPSWYELGAPPTAVDHALLHAINARLQPAEFVVEEQAIDPADAALPHIGMIKSHESLRKSFRLRTEKYPDAAFDLVLSLRPDVVIGQPVELDFYVEAARQPPFLHSIFSLTHYGLQQGSPFVGDRFSSRDVLFFGNQASMDRFSDIGLDRSIYQRHPVQQRTGEVYFDNFIHQAGMNLQMVELVRTDQWGVLRADGRVN